MPLPDFRFRRVSIHSLTQRETTQRGGGRADSGAFQSTPSRRGRLDADGRIVPPIQVSIHSLTQRETIRNQQITLFINVSIHSLTQRETQTDRPDIQTRSVSIHSLTQRETEVAAVMSAKGEFQSTPSRRGRQVCKQCIYAPLRFNPLPHAEGDLIFPAATS